MRALRRVVAFDCLLVDHLLEVAFFDVGCPFANAHRTANLQEAAAFGVHWICMHGTRRFGQQYVQGALIDQLFRLGFCATLGSLLRQVVKTLRQTSPVRMSYTHLIQRVLEKDGWAGFLTRGLKTKCVYCAICLAHPASKSCSYADLSPVPSSSFNPLAGCSPTRFQA